MKMKRGLTLMIIHPKCEIKHIVLQKNFEKVFTTLYYSLDTCLFLTLKVKQLKNWVFKNKKQKTKNKQKTNKKSIKGINPSRTGHL